MATERMNYKHICADHPYDPKMLFPAMYEAVNVFLAKPRGLNGQEFCYNGDHPVKVDDLKEIITYANDIWANREIYYFTEE